ncbi:MAG: hypothetical protein ABH986_03645 [archaeon]
MVLEKWACKDATGKFMVWGMECASTQEHSVESIRTGKNIKIPSQTGNADYQTKERFKDQNERNTTPAERQQYQAEYRSQHPKQNLNKPKLTLAEMIQKRRNELTEIHAEKNLKETEENDSCHFCDNPINPDAYAELIEKKTGQKIISCEQCAKKFMNGRNDFERNPFVESAQDFNKRHPKLKHRVAKEIASASEETQNDLLKKGLKALMEKKNEEIASKLAEITKKLEYETTQQPTRFDNTEKAYWQKQKEKLFSNKKRVI